MRGPRRRELERSLGTSRLPWPPVLRPKVVGTLRQDGGSSGWHGPFKIEGYDANGGVTFNDRGTFTLTRIEVDTTNGVVSLNGVVESAQQKARAEQLTRGVNGVKGVKNNLQISSS